MHRALEERYGADQASPSTSARTRALPRCSHRWCSPLSVALTAAIRPSASLAARRRRSGAPSVGGFSRQPKPHATATSGQTARHPTATARPNARPRHLRQTARSLHSSEPRQQRKTIGDEGEHGLLFGWSFSWMVFLCQGRTRHQLSTGSARADFAMRAAGFLEALAFPSERFACRSRPRRSSSFWLTRRYGTWKLCCWCDGRTYWTLAELRASLAYGRAPRRLKEIGAAVWWLRACVESARLSRSDQPARDR